MVPFRVNFSPEFKQWWGPQDRDLKKSILVHVGLLEEYGPQLGRPYADTLEGSELSNLKELRVQYRGDPYRILYAFDPKREAFLLIGGDKANDRRWYRRMIPQAETIFGVHLKALEEEEGK